MIGNTIKFQIEISSVFLACRVFALNGIILPISVLTSGSNDYASVEMVMAKDDESLPHYMPADQCQKEFLAVSNVVEKDVSVDCKICISNNSKWTYELGLPDGLTGYYSLEFDLEMDNGEICIMKRRRPKYLSDNGLSIKIKPGRKWECPISFDRRLWCFSPEIPTNKIMRIRPRYAFGAYTIDGAYYRTIEEIKVRKRRACEFYERKGELVGKWIDFNK